MRPSFRRLVLLSAVCALPFAAHAQTNDSRYGTWAPPGAPPGASQPQTQQTEALLKELKALIDEAEKARVADRLFLRDLRDLAARYENPWTVRQLFDDFADGEFQRDPAWSVASGEYFVEQGYGLRARPTQAAASTESRKVTKEEAIIGILGAVLQGGNKNGGDSGGAAATAQPVARSAVIETRARLSNSFAATVQMRSWKAEGAFELAMTQGISGAGYRVVYTAGQRPTLELVKVTTRGRGVIDAKQVGALEDQKVHALRWTRGADGSMTVSLDGKAVLNGRDAGFRDPFDGLAITQTGGDVIVKSVEVLGTR